MLAVSLLSECNAPQVVATTLAKVKVQRVAYTPRSISCAEWLLLLCLLLLLLCLLLLSGAHQILIMLMVYIFYGSISLSVCGKELAAVRQTAPWITPAEIKALLIIFNRLYAWERVTASKYLPSRSLSLSLHVCAWACCNKNATRPTHSLWLGVCIAVLMPRLSK